MKSLAPLTAEKVFSRSEYAAMNAQERQFAQEQLRNIFSKEMSRVTADMSRRQQVHTKLAELDNHAQTENELLMSSLNAKLINVQLKKKEQLRKRIQTCKLHDLNWQGKLKEQEARIKAETRDAANRLQKYQSDYQKYMESRKSKTQPSQTHHHPHTQQHRDFFKTQESHFPVETIRAPSLRSSSRKVPRRKELRPSHLDQLIRNHQEKSRKMEEQHQNEVFQRALNKLEHIKEVKQAVGRKRYSSPKPLSDSLQKPHREPSPALEYPLAGERHELRHRRVSAEQEHRRAQQCLGSQTTATSNRLLLRQKLEAEQSQRRWEQFERSQQRSKRGHILRQIRGKVAEYKLLAQRF